MTWGRAQLHGTGIKLINASSNNHPDIQNQRALAACWVRKENIARWEVVFKISCNLC